ncbi:unnamed protein product [Brachionus calyciflorus]|uniref:Tc1-like transposase DDE domain-containing protein n=1 Tax=Brachionus calyciflorus TaxID=104777 RepID=A0A814HBX8_9BILA|nr:unnamed protein product [Brachionus calyciflorus]
MPNQASKRILICKEDRIKAVFLNQKGKSYSEIGNELNRSKLFIKTIIDRYNKTKSYDDRPRSGRPRISTEKDERQLVRLVKKNRTSPSHILAHNWKLSNGKKASDSLVRRRLLEKKLEWKYAVRKPRISKAQKKARKSFCLNVKSWSKANWRQIMFSDEMNIELPSMDLQRQEKPFIFQQDNAPCHRAKLVKDWFQEQNIQVLAWPSNTSDLNYIETLWSWLDKEKAKQEPR